jgi:hypothetical protein
MAWFVRRSLTRLLGAALALGFGHAQSQDLHEASGIARSGDHLLIVDDSQHGAYFRFRLEGDTGPRILLDSSRLERVPLPQASMATDLESINVLADGRVVVLSERLRAMFDALGPVTDYGATLSEFGKRGLEGLAIRDLGQGRSRVAVLWEGGYPEFYDVPEQLRAKVGRRALKPSVQVHDLNEGDRSIQVRGSPSLTLDVPRPKGRGPKAQRFRAPDLVWHRLPNGKWGFIVLLTSQNSVDRPKYEYHWLECFTRSGERLGQRLDLDSVVGDDLKGVNWEGLDWFEDEKSLILIHESQLAGTPTAFVWQLPDDWKVADEIEGVFGVD